MICHRATVFRVVSCVLGVAAATATLATRAAAQTTSLVSVTSGGAQGNGPSGPEGGADISANGRFVVFTSKATNLVPSDNNGSLDVFLKDRESGALVRLSVASDGTERDGDSGAGGVAISDDGNVVAFASKAALVASDTNTCPSASPSAGTGPSCSDVYVFTRSSNTLARVSVRATGAEADGASDSPTLNADGSIVAFTSEATNLVDGDTNGAADVFLGSVVLSMSNIARVSVSSTNAQGDRLSFGPKLSDDGLTVAFVSEATNFSDTPNERPCLPMNPCARGFVRSLASATTARIPVRAVAPPVTGLAQSVTVVQISGDARFVATALDWWLPGSASRSTQTFLYDRLTDRSRQTSVGGGGGAGVLLSNDGRYLATNPAFTRLVPINGTIVDLAMNQSEPLLAPDSLVAGGNVTGFAFDFSANGRFLLVVRAVDVPTAGDANNQPDVFVADFDTDADGMRGSWETFFGLDPNNAADGTADADGDGLTNAQEYVTNGHPNGTFKRYFAEGAMNQFFNTSIAMFNAGGSTARVLLHYLGSDGNVSESDTITPLARRRAPRVLPPDNFSTVIESDQPIVADRRMIWGLEPASTVGSHSERAIESPAQTWYLAEGATHGAFDLFYLLQNANDLDTQVTIEYLRPAPAPPIVRNYTVAAHSRRTIWVDAEGPELEAADLSAKITADRPIIVERSMYFTRPGEPFAAGHNGAGVTAPALQWFLAEGATGAFFDLYVLIANPGDTDAQLDVTYLLPDGAPSVVKQYTVPARSRHTISVEGEDPQLASTAVSTVVASRNGVPVIVERSMWWPSSGWYEGHLSAGATTTGTRWAIADLTFEAYVLIANTSTRAGTATLKIYPDVGGPTERVVNLPANSRVNLSSADAFRGVPGGYSLIVETDGVEVVVERALYQSAGAVWSVGSDSLATKLP